jgi:hypothetical protein
VIAKETGNTDTDTDSVRSSQYRSPSPRSFGQRIAGRLGGDAGRDCEMRSSHHALPQSSFPTRFSAGPWGRG